MTEINAESNDLIHHRLRSGKITVSKVNYTRIPETASCNEVVSQINAKYGSKPKVVKDLTLLELRANEENAKKALRRSPRRLSKEQANSQKEVEIIKHNATKSSITESSKNASGERELLKIKDCWSPKASPDSKVRLLRNGRTLQLPHSPLRKGSPETCKKDNASFGDTMFNEIEGEITQRISEKDSNIEAATDLKRSYLYQDTVIDESFEYFPRRKKLRSEVTDDELWDGLPQNIRFKRLTPRKENTSSSLSLVVTIKDSSNVNSVAEMAENTNNVTSPDIADNASTQRKPQTPLNNHVLRRSPRKKNNFKNTPLQPTSLINGKSVVSQTLATDECSTPSRISTDISDDCYLNTVVPDDKPQEHGSQRLRTRRSLTKDLECTTDNLSKPRNKIQDDTRTNSSVNETAAYEHISLQQPLKIQVISDDVNTCSESTRQLFAEDHKYITMESKKIETRILRRSPRKTKRDSNAQGTELRAESDKIVSHIHNDLDQSPKTCNKNPYETLDSAIIKTEIIENTDKENGTNEGCEKVEHKREFESVSKIITENREKNTDRNSPEGEKEDYVTSYSDHLFHNHSCDVASPRKTTNLKEYCDGDTEGYADDTLLGRFDDSVPQIQFKDDVTNDTHNVISALENNMEETICYEIDDLKQCHLYEKENVSIKDKCELNEGHFEVPQRTDDNYVNNLQTADGEYVENPKPVDEESPMDNPDNQKPEVHQEDAVGIRSAVKIKVEPADDYFGNSFEVDPNVKAHQSKRRSECRNDTTPLKRSARLMDKRVNTPSRKYDVYLYSPIRGKNSYPESNTTVESKYTIIKRNIQSISGYSSDDSIGNTSSASSVKVNPTNRKIVEANMKTKLSKLSPFARSNLPYNQNATETNGCSHGNNDESEANTHHGATENSETNLSGRPTIKLRMQKTPDGQTRIISDQSPQLQLSPFVSLPRIDCQQDDKCEGITTEKKKNLVKNKSKSNTFTKDERKRNKATQEKNRGPKCPRRRPRSPSEEPRTMYERSCRRKTGNTEDILKNATIGKHASILWLSENRRHFLQKHSDRSSIEVDNIMATAWENLADKEKLRFYQRAKNAMKDENKHSAPKVYRSTETVPAQGVSRKMTKFLALSPTEQHNELKRWLAFVHEISPGEYAKLIADFKDAMKEEKCRRQTSRSKDSSVDIQSHHRRSLFQKILDVRGKIVDIYHQKREKQMELVKEGFDVISKRLIAGDQLNFSRTVRSEELEQVLTDLRCLENELKIAVSGTPLKSKSYDNVLEQLHDCEQELVTTSVLRSQDPEIMVDLPTADSVYAHELLQESINSNLWGEDPSTSNVHREKSHNTQEDLTISEEVLNYLSTYFEHEAHANFTASSSTKRTCPSQILTNWVLAEQFKSLSKNPSLFGSGVQMLVDPKHLVPFMKGQNVYNATYSQPRLTVSKEYFCATRTRPTSTTKNNNAVKRVPGVSKYDKYKRTTTGTPVIVHYSRPSKPNHDTSAECQRQPHLQFDHKFLHSTHYPTQVVYKKPMLVLKRDSSCDRAKPRQITQDDSEQRKDLTRLYSSQESIMEKKESVQVESLEDVTESQEQNPSISLQYIRRHIKFPEANSQAQRPKMSTLVQYPSSCVVQQEPSLPKSSSSVNEQTRETLLAEQERSLMYPYTHSVIHRKIHSEDGRTVVKFTATAFDGRRIS